MQCIRCAPVEFDNVMGNNHNRRIAHSRKIQCKYIHYKYREYKYSAWVDVGAEQSSSKRLPGFVLMWILHAIRWLPPANTHTYIKSLSLETRQFSINFSLLYMPSLLLAHVLFYPSRGLISKWSKEIHVERMWCLHFKVSHFAWQFSN